VTAPTLQSAVRLRQLEAQLQELESRRRELEALSGRLLQIQEDERGLLASELHDDPLQRAILVSRELRAADLTAARTREWSVEVDEIIASLRSIAAGLRPAVLDDLG
jgi:signal transduction histidine kinase